MAERALLLVHIQMLNVYMLHNGAHQIVNILKFKSNSRHVNYSTDAIINKHGKASYKTTLCFIKRTALQCENKNQNDRLCEQFKFQMKKLRGLN